MWTPQFNSLGGTVAAGAPERPKKLPPLHPKCQAARQPGNATQIFDTRKQGESVEKDIYIYNIYI